MEQHRSGSPGYSSDFKPWKLITFIGFDDEAKAREFEKYLKVGSGHAFAQQRLW